MRSIINILVGMCARFFLMDAFNGERERDSFPFSPLFLADSQGEAVRALERSSFVFTVQITIQPFSSFLVDILMVVCLCAN